jgi:Asp-tRNA(Asn)/Glu-tRNA(Gln) amidotransferase A subunit family amidase
MAAAVRAGSLSATTLITEALAAAEALDPVLHFMSEAWADSALAAGDLCWAFNLSGHPAVTVPAGLRQGLPVGLQAVAAPHRDDLALAFAELGQVRLPYPPVHWGTWRRALHPA